MARAGLGISLRKLAESAGVGESTIQRFEAGRGGMQAATLARVEAALETAGVKFLATDESGGPGVRLSMAAAALASD
ncbi:helix-turn-helix transcriptional regulator [Phenylobacterium sp.]|uniref:helix-turn-helix domain-containing protein n=1 Tax=Phenylobacterium sp. TaxID=1871053 RepID=UPI002E33F177|nr:helix-turn-helix transcriptional regulator [Phenylobacterium sp.]HEX3365770.1 helix-turn-helix transcriptional regulator [Phenylobacterium sp.]